MGKKSVAVVAAEPKPARVSNWRILTVKVARTVEFDAEYAISHAAESLNLPIKETRSKSGRVVLAVGKVTAGRAKLTDEERAQRKADRAQVKDATKSLRKLMRTDRKMAAILAKLAGGGTLTAEEVEIAKSKLNVA
jgi:hypothetical protein